MNKNREFEGSIRSTGRPKLVVFDMAGTTVRDDGGAVNRCLRDALASTTGIVATEEAVNVVMGFPKPEALRRLLSANGVAVPEIEATIATAHADFVQRMKQYYAESPSVGAISGAEDTFAALRTAGIKVGLDTGFSRDIADIILMRLGWHEGDQIDASITSDEVSRGRPFPDMVQNLMVRFGITDAARVAKVGDTPSDLQEGTAAGCGWVIGVTESGSHTTQQLSDWPHTDLVPSLRSLPKLFGI
jgi:phosphonatase-like hydrolase